MPGSKRPSAFDQALIERQQRPASAPVAAPVAPTPQLRDEAPSQPERPAAEQTTVKNAVGRPKGIDKVKGNFYLTTAVDDLPTAQLELASKLKLLIKDNGTMVDLALSYLCMTLEEGTPTELERVKLAYNRVKQLQKADTKNER
jgi:hypothetical protein